MKIHEQERLQAIADGIVRTIIKKDEAYGSSWKDHGGYSAFFNLHRKYSRVEHGAEQFQYDLFKATIELEEGIDSLQDLIAYALLTLTEVYDPSDEQVEFEVKPAIPDRLHRVRGLEIKLDDTGEPGPSYVDQDKEE